MLYNGISNANVAYLKSIDLNGGDMYYYEVVSELFKSGISTNL